MNFEYFEAETHVSTYNKFRPSPPDSLYAKIIEFTKEKISDGLETAIDIGCGSGQSTEKLAKYFKTVYGLDPSLSIISEATKKSKFSNITYRQSAAENIDIQNEIIDVITAGQAIQWFDLPKFYSEANRLLHKNGVLAVYGYNLPSPIFAENSKELSDIVKKYYSEVLGDFVFDESRKVYLENYKGDEFNDVFFVENGRMQRFEGFVTESEASISDISGYVSSWSAFQNFSNQKGATAAQKVLDSFEAELREVVGEDSGTATPQLKIQFLYFLLLGRKV